VIDGNPSKVRPFFGRRNIPPGRVIPGETRMAHTASDSIALPVIPVGELLPWAVFGGLLLLLALYFVGAEQGATSLISNSYVHEFVHDGRHLLGFPCH
jgi:hypothetical protein